MRSAPPGEEFVLQDGRRLRSVDELAEALEEMDDGHFRHFADGKNDFANWIEHSLDEKFLAAAVRRAQTKAGMQKVLFIARFR